MSNIVFFFSNNLLAKSEAYTLTSTLCSKVSVLSETNKQKKFNMDAAYFSDFGFGLLEFLMTLKCL